jgi:hypothetical protein
VSTTKAILFEKIWLFGYRPDLGGTKKEHRRSCTLYLLFTTVFQKGPVSGSLFFIVFLCAGLGRCILTRPAPAGSAFFKKLPKGRIQVAAFREFFLKFYDLSDVFRIFESGVAFPGSSYCSKI